MCTACKMNHGHKRMGDTSEAHEELARRVAAKAGHPAGLQARADATPITDTPPQRTPVRANARFADPEPDHGGSGDHEEPMRDNPNRKRPPYDVKHIHITDNVWREPATWLAAALALSAVATVTTAFIYTRAKG